MPAVMDSTLLRIARIACSAFTLASCGGTSLEDLVVHPFQPLVKFAENFDIGAALAASCERQGWRMPHSARKMHRLLPLTTPRVNLNLTWGLVKTGHKRRQVRLASVFEQMETRAFWVRGYLGTGAQSCPEYTACRHDVKKCPKAVPCVATALRWLGYWAMVWCEFVRKLFSISADLPVAGLVQTALGVSTADILRRDFPAALAGPLTSLADGGVEYHVGSTRAYKLTTSFTELLEHSMFLGQEMLRHGTSRVSKAEYHWEAANVGSTDNTRHRAEVLLWCLNGSWDGNPPPASPLMAELGVAHGENLSYLLARYPTLRAIGVDSFAGSEVDMYRGTTATEVYREATTALKPWLGSRARLVVGRTEAVDASVLGTEPFDFIFVDAEHDEASVRADLAAWMPRVRPRGIMAGHDYAPQYPGVVRAVHAMLPKGVTLHLGPQHVYWWRVPGASLL